MFPQMFEQPSEQPPEPPYEILSEDTPSEALPQHLSAEKGRHVALDPRTPHLRTLSNDI